MLTLHYSKDAASLVVRVVLEELGLPYDTTLIDRKNGGLDTPAYRALHPIGKIPVLETPDGPVFETAAILLWLADKHRALAPAIDAPDRAAFLKWYIFTNNALHTTLLHVFYPERVAGPDCSVQVVAMAVPAIKGHLAQIDRMIAAEHPAWLSPDQPSILGHYLGMLLRWVQEQGPDDPAHIPVGAYPALLAVLRAHQARPAVAKAAADEGLPLPIYVQDSGA
jgi:glutathione S-transferase